MPPRYTYWTIILEGKPTAFRASKQEELLPTLKQLQARHPDAVMLWFARGKLWQSEEEAREALRARRRPEERRGPDWRPGGSHQDPRERFKIPRDEKRRRFKERLYRDRTEPSERHGQSSPRRPVEGKPSRPERSPQGSARPPHEEKRPWKPAGPQSNRFRPAGSGGTPQRRFKSGPASGGGKPEGRFRPSGPAKTWSASGRPRGKFGGRKPGGDGRKGGGGSSR